MAKDVSLVRIKADTNDYERSIRQAQKTWDSFTKGLGVNVGKFTMVGAAIAGVTAALKVAKDAFFKNEQQLDEWGRTVKASESLYAGFLNALNNGNISGYLQNINSIVTAARNAYDALDALGTFNAFNQVNVSKTQANLTNAMADLKEGVGSKEAVQVAAAAYQKELESRRKLEQNAYEAEIKRVAAEHNISSTFLQSAITGSYENYEWYKNQGLTGIKKQVIQDENGNDIVITTKVAANAAEEVGQVLRQLNDTELKDLQALGAAAYKTSNDIANVSRQVARVLGGGSGGSGSGKGGKTDKETYTPLAGSIDSQTAKVKELQDAFNKAAEEGVRQGLLKQLKEAEGVLKLMKEEAPAALSRGGSSYELLGGTLTGGGLNSLKDVKIEGKTLDDLQALANAGETAADSWSDAMGAISGLSGALSAIEDPAVKVLGIIAEAIATIALTFAKSLKGTVTPWDWIAGAAAGTATMISTIAAIKSATAGSFAEGGIVPGNNHNDGLIANVSSGELILNKSQQNNIAALLRNQGNAGRSYQPAYVSGEQIYIAMNRYLKRSGQGELMTWKS